MSLYAPMTLSRFSEDDRGRLLVAGIVRCRSFLFSGLREVIIELVQRNSLASSSAPTIGTKVVNMSLTNKVQLVKTAKHPIIPATLAFLPRSCRAVMIHRGSPTRTTKSSCSWSIPVLAAAVAASTRGLKSNKLKSDVNNLMKAKFSSFSHVSSYLQYINRHTGRCQLFF